MASIAFKLHGKSKTVEDGLSSSQKVRHFLKHFEYTGYALNLKGLEILKKFDNFEIDSLSELKDKQYYNSSLYYTEKIVSISNWIKTRERLRLNRKAYKVNPEKRTARSSLATGMIKCGFCNSPFYNIDIKKKTMTKKGEKIYNNRAYHHHIKINRLDCNQSPKSFNVEKIDNVFKLFFFYFYLVFCLKQITDGYILSLC